MKYLNSKFQVSYGSKEYKKGWKDTFHPTMDKKVICLFWKESPWSEHERAWSLHITVKDAEKFKKTQIEAVYDSYGDIISVEKLELVMITEKLYDKVCRNCGKDSAGGLFVDEIDFVPIQMEMFK
jgi:hypothetical protein